MNNARVIERTATLYAEPKVDTPLTELPVGAELELGAADTGQQWLPATLPDGSKGFLTSDATVFTIKPVILLQDDAAVHSQPSPDSAEVVRLRRDDPFQVIGTAAGGGFDWFLVRDPAGHEGFIEVSTSMSIRQHAPDVVSRSHPTEKDAALKGMGVGAIWLIVGVAVTAGTYSAVSDSGGSYLVMWGPMGYGAWRILKGLFQYFAAE